jgi:hypothetical protein
MAGNLEGLKRSEPLSWASAERWRQLVADAENLLSGWSETADRLDWATLDLFGVHSTAPAARFDVMGLIPILRGANVVTACFRAPNQSSSSPPST